MFCACSRLTSCACLVHRLETSFFFNYKIFQKFVLFKYLNDTMFKCQNGTACFKFRGIPCTCKFHTGLDFNLVHGLFHRIPGLLFGVFSGKDTSQPFTRRSVHQELQNLPEHSGIFTINVKKKDVSALNSIN